jgi:uncharacterized protein YrrD
MTRSMKDLVGYPIDAEDGKIGRVDDFLLDDEELAVRYMVADTGGWLSSDLVLISPRHLKEPDLGKIRNHLPVGLTREQVESCPPLALATPISRQYELRYARHYGLLPYWRGGYLWGSHGNPAISPLATPQPPEEPEPQPTTQEFEPTHLRSFSELRLFGISAKDGDIGTVDDFIVECHSWQLRFLVVDTNKWLPGGKVLVSVDWLSRFNWSEGCVEVELSKEQIKGAPLFDPTRGVNENYERELYDYYGKPVREITVPAMPF